MFCLESPDGLTRIGRVSSIHVAVRTRLAPLLERVSMVVANNHFHGKPMEVIEQLLGYYRQHVGPPA